MAKIQTTLEKAKITVQGLRLLTKIMLTGASLKLTRAAIGEGISDAEPSSLAALVKEVLSHKTGEEGTSATVDLQTLAATDDTTAAMRILIQNGDTEFVLREIGIYAQDPDGDEILYAYTCDKSEYAMPFPSNADGAHVSETVDIAFFVSNVENIDADITLPAEMSLAEFTAHKSAEELDHPDGSVTTRKIADNAISQSKLSNDCVAQSKIINGAVTTNKIGDGAVTNKKIEDGAITLEKLSNELQAVAYNVLDTIIRVDFKDKNDVTISWKNGTKEYSITPQYCTDVVVGDTVDVYVCKKTVDDMNVQLPLVVSTDGDKVNEEYYESYYIFTFDAAVGTIYIPKPTNKQKLDWLKKASSDYMN